MFCMLLWMLVSSCKVDCAYQQQVGSLKQDKVGMLL